VTITRETLSAETLARLFHDTYERLAPAYGYRTREASARPWEDVPEQNRALMIATAGQVLNALDGAFLLTVTRPRAGWVPGEAP
jgi:hypothetical protein